MNKTEFGSYIKESRLKKNYTQKQLADLLFIDVSAVSKWERGVSFPDITLVPDICKVLDISEHELISASSDHEYRRMKKDAKTFNNMKKGTFWTFNICYAIALLVCFIVNISVNKTLSWFFVVAASILCAYSFCPTFTWISKKFKFGIFVGTTFISLFLLYLTCSIYTNNYWFMIATTGTLIGYFLLFFPILFKKQKEYFTEDKYNKLTRYFPIIYTSGIWLLISVLLISINCYYPINLLLGISINSLCFLAPTLYGVLNIFNSTRSYRKPFLIIVGSIVFIFISISFGFSIHNKSTEKTNTYYVTESYNNIKIDGGYASISLYQVEEDNERVVAREYEDIAFELNVINDTLIISLIDSRNWYESLYNISKPSIKIYISKSAIESLIIDSDTSNIVIDGNFTINKTSIETDTGDIKIKNLTGDKMNLEADTGDIKIYNLKYNNLNVETDTGDIKLTNTIIGNDMEINSDSGDVILVDSDAYNIYITVDSGEVEGTLLSSKIFIVKTNSGNIKVPETTSGGICKIKTDSGDIRISIKE